MFDSLAQNGGELAGTAGESLVGRCRVSGSVPMPPATKPVSFCFQRKGSVHLGTFVLGSRFRKYCQILF